MTTAWTRFEALCKKHWRENNQDELPKGENANKTLLDFVVESLKLNKKQIDSLHKARMVRNDLIHDKPTNPNPTMVKNILKISEQIDDF